MTSDAQDSYIFGQFRIDARTRRLFRDGVQVSLSPRAFDLLMALVLSNGLVLAKEELLKRLWPDVNVGEHNLTQTISVLRRILGETPGAYRHIMTVPGRGYRFVGCVESTQTFDANSVAPNGAGAPDGLASPIAPSGGRHFRLDRQTAIACTIGAMIALIFIVSVWRESALSPAPKPLVSMAVLPFRSLDDESIRAKLGTALADGLIRRLGENRAVKISPMSDVLKYECPATNLIGAGRELGVDSVVEGRIQKVDGKVRITVQMVKVSDGTTQWTDVFDGKFTDSFSLEDLMAEKLAPGITKAAYR